MTSDVDRATARLLAPYVLDVLVILDELQGRYDLGLIFALVALANVEHVPESASFDPDMPWSGVPDGERRPISASAIAHELNLPLETVRRQVQILIERGVLVRQGTAGLICPGDYLRRPEVDAAERAMLKAFLSMAVRMMDAGFDWPREAVHRLPTAETAQRPVEVTIFLVCRHLLSLTIRLLQIGIKSHERLETFLLSQALNEQNHRQVAHDPVLARQFARSDGPAVPEHLLEPALISVVCGRTGMSRPTVNRMVRALVTEGAAHRVGQGVVVRPWALETPASQARIVAMHQAFLATASRLAVLGMGGEELRRWHGEVSGLTAPTERPRVQEEDRTFAA